MAGAAAFFDVVGHGSELAVFTLKDEVGLVGSNHGLVGGDLRHLQAVGFREFGRFCLSGSRHARKLFVLAVVVLQRDRCEGLVFLFDLDALFGFDGLV